MANDIPTLVRQPWYRGLTRYQWWVLIIASMGWMFDTMDQHFFTIGRGPAMQEVLGYDPVKPGLAKLGDRNQSDYTIAELDGLVAAGLLTDAQKARLSVDRAGQPRLKVTRKDVAAVIGSADLAPKLTALGLARLQKEGLDQPAYDGDALNKLVAANVVTRAWIDQLLRDRPTGEVTCDELARELGREFAKVEAEQAGGMATTIFIMGWAIGGLLFGWIGDWLGRAKTMALTILLYSIFTGLSGLAETPFQFNLLRFLTALGVGGEFAAGAALVAESMPDRSRPAALGTLQALSAVGNMLAAFLAFFIMPTLGWRWLFALGALPGVVAVFVFLGLREPDKWREARARWLEQKATGQTVARSSYLGILQDARWRKRALIGLLLGVVGVGGLWGVAFFTPELNRLIAVNYSVEAKERFVNAAFFLQQLGAFFGISAYTFLALRIGRVRSFGIFFALAFVIVAYTFLFADTIVEAYALAPLVGFVTLGPFGGFAIYFPELFPTRLRATGVGFCYNVGRFLAALVPSLRTRLQGVFMSGALALPFLPAATGNAELAIRYGSFLMIFIYLVGLVVLLFAPETKDQPLPED